MKNSRFTALALGTVAALLLAGCAGAPRSEPNGTEASTPFDPANLTLSTPAGTKTVDHVSWGLHLGEPDTIDPVRVGNDSGYIAIANMCDTLFQIQPDFSIEPGLALSAGWTDDTTFVIELRDGVTFWDGSPLTAEDVAFSLTRAADPESQSVNTSAFEYVENIRATGDLQVTVTFTKTDFEFSNVIAGPAGYIFQKAFTEAVGEEEIGTADGGVMCTGPFVFEKWIPGKSILTTANENYWGGAPLVKELEYEFVSSDSTLASALLAGEIDGAFDVPAASGKNFESSDNGDLFIGPSTAAVRLGNTGQGPGADPKLRRALILAIDKDAFISTVLHGYGAPLKSFVPPFLWQGLEGAEIYQAGYDALPDTAQNLDEAKALIDEIGVPDKTLVLAIPAGDQQSLQSAVIVQAAGADLGVKIEIQQLQGTEFGRIFYDDSARVNYDLLITAGYIDTPGVLLYPSFFVKGDGLFNWSGWNNPAVDEAMEKARTTTDPIVSAEEFVKAQAIFAPDFLPLASQYTRVFLDKELTGVTTSFSYIASPWALKLGAK